VICECAADRIAPLMLQAGFAQPDAGTKKPAAENPRAGTHFVSFNFLNARFLRQSQEGGMRGIVQAGAATKQPRLTTKMRCGGAC
jgi:hypothetical protein